MFLLTCLVCRWRGPAPARLSGCRVACPCCGAEKSVPRYDERPGDLGWRPVAEPRAVAASGRGRLAAI